MIIKTIIKEIGENNKSIFNFEGFDIEKDKKLKSELLYAIEKKYGNRNYSENKREQIAGKNINELKAYHMLDRGTEDYISIDNPNYHEIITHLRNTMTYEECRRKALEILGV